MGRPATSGLVPPEELDAVFGRREADAVESLIEKPARASRGIWRIRCGVDSAVLKVVAHGHGGSRWPATDDPNDPWYWRREVSAYEAGVGRSLGDVRGPRLRHLAERPDGSVALWLEDIPASGSWDAEQLRAVTLRIAGANDSPDEPWLSRGWFRSYLGRRASLIAAGGASGAVLAAGADAVLDRLDRRLDRVPQVFCHFDLHPGNVLGGGQCDVVFDWAYCGVGAAGLDAGVLALDALFGGIVPVEDGREVLAAVWDGYARLRNPRGSAREANLLIISGSVSHNKMAAPLRRIIGGAPSRTTDGGSFRPSVS